MGPETRYARVAVAPIFPSNAAVAAFGLAIDRVRIVVVRPVADTLADTTVSLPPDADVLDLNLRVPIVTSPESVLVSIIALSGTIQLFEGTAPVEVSAGVVTQPTEIPVTNYVGPGAGVDSLAITPRTPFIYFGDSLRFQIQAFQGGTAVPQFYVSWSTSDSALAHINGAGMLRAPASRTNVRVIARTPGGAADSITATFQPAPNQLVLVAGGGQSGLVGQPLAVPLTVEVRAADNFPVAGTAVRFRAPAGGLPADTTVIADGLGHATVNAMLGSAIGAQTFQITLPGFPSVSLNVGATANSGAISPATSIISVSNGSVQSGNAVTLTLQGKDGGGNNMTAGGATVVFSVTGGTSTGTIAPSPATDNGNGTYTASFTGVLAGTATTIHATIDGGPVASALPTVAVTPGAISPVTSVVSVSAASIGSGGTATLTLQAKDAAGNNLTTGGATVAFTVSGGTSAGTIGPITDHANGTYTAVFTATVAGSAATIGATIAAVPVSSTLPTITVNAGAVSAATSVLSASTDSIASGAVVVLRLQAKDPAGNNLTSGGATVVFTHSGGTSTGAIGATADSGTGVYTATFTGVVAGTATTIAATLNGTAVTTGAPTIAVKPGLISTAASVITASTDTLLSGAIATLKLRAKDAAGNLLTGGGATVVFSASGGASTGAIGTTADSGTGVYTANFTGQAAGTATTIHATINGGAVTSTLPTVVVKPGAPAQLAFTVQPSAAFIGTPIAPAVQVTARDAFGNTTPAFTASVTIAIGTNPASGVLGGTLSRAAVAGVATFNDLQVDQSGVGYTLTASASGLASGTSAAFDLLAPSGTIAWTNAAGGNWSNPANWNGGVVPGPTDIALITLPGTYTVTFDVNDTIGGVQLGGSSGIQTLSLVSRTLGLAAGSQINATGVLTLQSSTITGAGSITNAGKMTVRQSSLSTGLVNQNALFVEGTTALNGPVSTTPASTLRVQGNGVFSTGNLTVANGFTNNGTILLTDSVSTYGATLHVTSGTLTNAPGASMQSLVGANGTRNLDAQLDNQGTIDISKTMSLTKSGAVAHSNSGTINVNAKFTIQQSGVSSSFTNTGAIAIGSGDTVVVTAGTFAYSGGSISGGVLTIGSATVNASQSFTTATTALVLTNTTWGGSGTLTIAPSTALTIAASTLNSVVDNQGTLTAHGTTAFNGGFTNASGATLRLQGDGTYSTANVTFATGFTNSGAIVLTDTTSSYGAVLNVTSGTLINAAGATLTAAVGTNGTRSLNAQLDNQGTLTLDRAFTLNKPSAAHSNTGTIDVNGKFTILQGGVSPSFTQSGTINIAAGDTVAVSSGAFNYASGAINGPGAITFTSTVVTLTQGLATAAVPYGITSSTVNGPGALTVSPSTIVQIKASTINAPLVNQGGGQLDLHGSTAITGAFTNASGATLRLQGDGTYSTANISFATAFTNNGAIVLTDTTSSYGAILNLTTGQRLTNAPGATITAAVGTAGQRTIGAELDNQGTLTLNRPLTLSEAGAQHLNSGTIDISGGDFTLSQSGTTPSFTTSGTITIGAGRIFQVNSGTLNYNAGTISGSGTLAISSATVATTQDFSTATTALTLTSATWGGSGKLTVAAGTLLNVKASTINSRLVNLGNLDAHGATAFNDSVTNASGATLRVQGDGTYSTGNLTVANGFTNDGTIVLTDTTSSYGAILHVTSGTFVNAAGGTVRADSGTRGPKTIDAQFDNEGAVAIAWPLTLQKASAAHVNRGTIGANAKFTISLSGTTPSFRQVGTLTIGTGDTVTVNAGTFVYDSGTISGGGGALALSGTTVQAAHDFSTASTALKVTSVTWSGAGTLTVAPSTALVLQASTINSGIVNQGDVTINGLSNLNGAVTNAAGATLRVQGNGTYSTGTLVLANGFTNNGTIVLTDTTSTYGAVLNVTSGTLVNAPGGTIRADTGTNGLRTFNATLDNQGTFISAVPASVTTTLNKASAAQQNSGTWTIASGTVTIQGAGASFTNAAGGTVQGAGVFKVSGVPFTNNGSINPGTAGTGILKVVGNYTQASTGALNVQLGGTTAGTQYDRLVDSAGTATLNGALTVSLVNGFTPALGDTFTVLTFPSRSGTFPTLTGLTLGGVNLDTLWSATSLRLVTISAQTVHATDITTSQTWTAAASPHIVSGYLKVVNGATLTIEDGATVKFNAAAGLQIGDTALAQTGSLVMLGTPGSIHLTANTGTPAAGFWKGLELQKAGAAQSWRNVDIEYAGGARANPLYEACVLLVDTTASVDLDSLHLRQCANSGLKHFGGSALVHRSIIDTTGNSGVLAGFGAVLRLDSTTIRGAQTGLMMLTQFHPAAGVVGNTLSGNVYPAEVTADALSAFGANLLTGNSRDTMLVQAGTLAAPYTMKRYTGLGWHVTGPIVIDSGAVLSIDTGTAVLFDTSAMVIVGSVHPSALHIEGSSANPVLLTASNPAKGWPGLRYVLLSGTGNATQNLLRNAIIEHSGRHQLITCGDGCVYFNEGAIKFQDTASPDVILTVDSVIVRHSIGYAVEVQRGSGGGKVSVTHSQFYDNPLSPVFVTDPSDIGGLAVEFSDIYHYGGTYSENVVSTMYGAQFDSLDFKNNWWGDVAGPKARVGADFGTDSLRRADLGFYAVRTSGFTTIPYFPGAIGAPVSLVALPDSQAISGIAGGTLTDSLRSRLLDAFGRGVPAKPISWNLPGGCGSLTGAAPTTDAGGRGGVQWTACTVAGDHIATATSAGATRNHHVLWQPGATTALDFALIQTDGIPRADSNEVTFTSSGHRGVFVTRAKDSYGNVTQPTTVPSFCFTDVPFQSQLSQCHNPQWYAPQYGSIDSVKADTVYFTVTAATPAAMQIRAEYNGGALVDSMLIAINGIAAGMKLSADTADFSALCPTIGPYNAFCRRTFTVSLVDSAGAPLPPNDVYHFTWANAVPGDTTVTIDAISGLMGEVADITAHGDGTASIIAQQSLGVPLRPDRDTLAITAAQRPQLIKVTPDTLSAGIGDIVTFTADAIDIGGASVPGATIKWRLDAPAGSGLTIIDFPTANSVRVRLDSTVPSFPRDLAVVTAFTERAPGDTLFAPGILYNPTIQTLTGLPSQPWAVAVDPRTNRAYVADRGNANVAVVDLPGNRIIRVQDVGTQPEHVTVDSRNARVYVTNTLTGTLSVLDGAANGQLLATIPVGSSPSFIAVDSLNNRAYLASDCADPPACTVRGAFLLAVDGGARAIIPQDTVRLPAPGTGVAYDEINRLVYVSMANDSVAMVDPAGIKYLGEIAVDKGPQGMAINPLTRKLYVASMSASSVSIIDLTQNKLMKSEFVQSTQPQRVAVDQVKNRIYVAGYGNFLIDQIDGTTDTNIGYRSVNCAYPNDVAVNPQNRDLLTPCWQAQELWVFRFLTHP